MEVEIVSQCLRKIDRNKERFVTADAKDVRELLGSSGSSLYECNYVAELRMGNYLSRYDDVIHMLLDDRNNLGERNKAAWTTRAWPTASTTTPPARRRSGLSSKTVTSVSCMVWTWMQSRSRGRFADAT